jgi:hypothetical protein
MNYLDRIKELTANRPIVRKIAILLLTTAQLGSKPSYYVETFIVFWVKLLIVVPLEILIMLATMPIAAYHNWRHGSELNPPKE